MTRYLHLLERFLEGSKSRDNCFNHKMELFNLLLDLNCIRSITLLHEVRGDFVYVLQTM